MKTRHHSRTSAGIYISLATYYAHEKKGLIFFFTIIIVLAHIPDSFRYGKTWRTVGQLFRTCSWISTSLLASILHFFSSSTSSSTASARDHRTWPKAQHRPRYDQGRNAGAAGFVSPGTLSDWSLVAEQGRGGEGLLVSEEGEIEVGCVNWIRLRTRKGCVGWD